MSSFRSVALRLRTTKTSPVKGSLLTESRKTIDPAAKIDRLDGDEELHLGRDLEHQRAFPKPRASASMSAAS